MNLSKYNIERCYIAKRSNTRPGLRLTIGVPAFFVAHDTGNPGADAENHYRYFNTLTGRSASAHTFIDDKQILEIIPTGTGPDPGEKAWHVLYNVTTDNERFGYNANDAAIGVELCYGGGIDFEAAYKRFVWYLAFCCTKWNKAPRLFIPSHKQLDPARKIDCDNALKIGGRTLKDLIVDVVAEIAVSVVPSPAPAPKPAESDFATLPVAVATELIDKYVRPAWSAARAAKQQPEADHFHRLAVNLRSAGGVDNQLRPLVAAVKLHKSNVQEIVFRWLSPAWYAARDAGDPDQAKHYNAIANHLRAAAGMPIE
ncbi:N-acetylmuramoyl-L-alanine amidase [Saccharibacillus sp. O23]|uniref:peptidoglycan recognition protein family protein n=1 Tax=Saccharibacillus sp. O23 TaxID=2009338 RepID=UPI000B4E5988|nr:N-acetylmuramoyl-L-alanine amidase [Saccharibacillus sp. O23]OWR32688.1 N-acetylmuramoyl-L-alanine amidase [Saccharibacillus sp. O23]